MPDCIHGQIVVSKDNYKFVVDLHKRLKEFAIEDEVMVRLHREVSLRNFKEDSYSTYGSTVLKFGSNAYEFEILMTLTSIQFSILRI